MVKKATLFVSLAALFVVAISSTYLLSRDKQNVGNVILFVGDGMGFEHVRAGSLFMHGKPGKLSFESFPAKGQMEVTNAFGQITDSAASASAMATGRKVYNGGISMRDGKAFPTLLEMFKKKGMFVGLVTNTDMTHATPAAFASHVDDRRQSKKIADQYFLVSRPNLIFGGAYEGFNKKKATFYGYEVIENRDQLLKKDFRKSKYLMGAFGEMHMPYEYDGMGNLPHLSEMAIKAVETLANRGKGFFLVVEGGKIDHAGHINDTKRNVYETAEFSRTVAKVYEWAKDRKDTLIVVTADHETGGLKIGNAKPNGRIPPITWSTKGHTDQKVPVYAWGKGSERFKGSYSNTDIFKKISATFL